METKQARVDAETHEIILELSDRENITVSEAVRRLINERNEFSIEDVSAVKAEEHQKIRETKTAAKGLLEALDEMDLLDDAKGIIRDMIDELTEQDMLETNQDIVDYLLQSARDGDELTEFDRLLAEVVIETEQARDAAESPAAELARGLFSGEDSREVERSASVTRTEPAPNADAESPTTETDGIATSVERVEEEL